MAQALRVAIRYLRKLFSYSGAVTSGISPKTFQDFVQQTSGPISPLDHSSLVARSETWCTLPPFLFCMNCENYVIIVRPLGSSVLSNIPSCCYCVYCRNENSNNRHLSTFSIAAGNFRALCWSILVHFPLFVS